MDFSVCLQSIKVKTSQTNTQQENLDKSMRIYEIVQQSQTNMHNYG